MKNLKLIIAISAAALLTVLCGCGPKKPVLHFYTWSDYIDDELIEQFQDEFNCIVVKDTFDSNESMYAKLKAGAAGYDVIQPSSYMADVMYEEKMIDVMDKSKIPNLKYINADFLKEVAIDKDMTYSVPYLVCFSMIGYNKAKLGDIEPTWTLFADKKYSKKVTMLNDMRETMGVALKVLGYSLNTLDDKQLEEAKNLLISWKGNFAKLDNEMYKSGLNSQEYVLVHGYSGDLFQIIEENEDLDFLMPKEGFSVACDDWVIPSDSKNKDLAYAFINFMSDPKRAAKNFEYTCYLPPVDGFVEFVDEEMKEHPTITKAKEIYKKGEVIKDLRKDNKKYEKLWEEMKLAN